MKLSHAASRLRTAITELRRTIGVGSGALLGGFSFGIKSLLSHFYGLGKQWGDAPAPKPSLLELVKIYLNPRTLWFAVCDGSKKVCGTVKRWISIKISWRLLDILPVLDGRVTERNEKIFGGSWLNLLLAKWRKQKRISVIRASEVNPNGLNEKRHILRVTSDRNVNGRRIISYACSDAEWITSLYCVESNPVNVGKQAHIGRVHNPPPKKIDATW